MSQTCLRNSLVSCKASAPVRQAKRAYTLPRICDVSRQAHQHAAQKSQHLSRRTVRAFANSGADMGMDPDLKKSIDDLIASNAIVVFMKGSRQFPQCGFSNTVVQILNTMEVRYETVDILADSRLRSGMKMYSQWPTFPQVYINGEFFGGCDIMIETYKSGELKEQLEIALNS